MGAIGARESLHVCACHHCRSSLARCPCARAVAADLHAAHAFTALAVISLRCKACAQGLKGEADAMAHANATGHAEFEEDRGH